MGLSNEGAVLSKMRMVIFVLCTLDELLTSKYRH